METHMLTVWSGDDYKTNVTRGILEICDNKRTITIEARNQILATFRKLVITGGPTIKEYKLSVPYFYIYGGFGMVFGLSDFDESNPGEAQSVEARSGEAQSVEARSSEAQSGEAQSGEALTNDTPKYILKVDCSSHDGVILATAIKVNLAFNEYGGGQYDRYKALECGRITGSPKTFAVYTFLGEELFKLIFGEKREQMLGQEAKVKTIIRNVILCLREFNENYLVHGDVSPSNIVIDTKGKASLIDFDIMKNLKKLIGDDVKECSCSFSMNAEQSTRKQVQVYNVYPIINYKLADEHIQIEEYWGMPLIPAVSQLRVLSQANKQSLMKKNNVTKNGAETVKGLMMADKFGLFWVIIKILFSANYGNITEDGIDQFFGINYQRSDFIASNSSYMSFYNSLLIGKNFERIVTDIIDNIKYIKSDKFEPFIRELFQLITFDNTHGNIASFDNLLGSQFLLDTEQSSEVTSVPPPPHGGSYNKKRRPSRATRHTKKRNTRKKQNRRNKTKRVKLNRIRK